MDADGHTEVHLLVFLDDAVRGGEPVALTQGYSGFLIDDPLIDRVGVLFNRYDDEYDVGDGTFLISALMLEMGARVEPGSAVASVRGSATSESCLIYHEAVDGSEVAAAVAAYGANTAMVPGYGGLGWVDPSTARYLELGSGKDPGPVDEWPVNAALRGIGVRRGDAPDEAAALGLRLPHHPTL